ncbi:MAG: 2-oxo-hepta-3-ene-1,7-dioic acid hydratase [Actinomycetota bacterium]
MTLTLSADQITAEATLLDNAAVAVAPIRQTTSVYPDATIDDAYAIQAAWRERQVERGAEIVGHKIGLTSRAMQAAMQIDTPDSGFITDAMVFEPDSELSAADFCDLKLEVELAFVLRSDLVGRDLNVDNVLDATDFIVPAVELIDARSYRRDPETGRPRTVIDTIADNAADAGIVCGGSRIAPRQLDLGWVGAIARRNGVVEETGLAAGVLGHPAFGIAWLAHRYAEQGLALEAGQTILAGSFTRPIDVRPGDEFEFDYGPQGCFGLAFEGER